jgi:phenylacetate-CoA ligase
VNIYPSHIDQILSNIREVGSEYQVTSTEGQGRQGPHDIRVERAQGTEKSHDADKHIRKTIEKEVKRQVLVSCDVEVEDYGSLPRSERKTKRVFDERDS